MPDGDRHWMLDALLAPLMLPRRAARDLEAIGSAADGVLGFESALLAHLDELQAGVR